MGWRGIRITMRAVLVVGALASGAGTAVAAIPQGNLVANGDAEAGPGATDAVSFACPPAWTCSAGPVGGPTAVRYGTPGFPDAAEGQRIGGGLNFFAGGPNEPTSLISQRVDVSSSSAEIDAGQGQVTVSACLGGNGAEADAALLTAAFLSGADVLLGQAGPLTVTQSDRNDATKLLLRSSSGPVPPGTRQILLELRFNMGTPPYNDGYVDNATVTMSGLGTLPPATTCIGPPPPPPNPPPTVDKSGAKLSLGGNTTQRIARQRAVFVRVTADEAATFSAKGTLSVAGASKVFRLRKATASAAARQTRKLKLTISRKATRATRRALRRKRKVVATVTVSAVDKAGNRSSAKRTIRARR